jgi:hypothetical protein
MESSSNSPKVGQIYRGRRTESLYLILSIEYIDDWKEDQYVLECLWSKDERDIGRIYHDMTFGSKGYTLFS